jgi:hypothetical protein
MLSSSTSHSLSLADRIEAIDHAIKVKELAPLLNCSPTNLYNRAREGRLGPKMVLRWGATIRFDPHWTAEWLRSL